MKITPEQNKQINNPFPFEKKSRKEEEAFFDQVAYEKVNNTKIIEASDNPSDPWYIIAKGIIEAKNKDYNLLTKEDYANYGKDNGIEAAELAALCRLIEKNLRNIKQLGQKATTH